MSYKKLNDIINAVFTEDLAKNIIIQKGDEYHVYNKFIISKTWEVRSITTDDILQFMSSKNALTYCILIKAEQQEEAKLLVQLDRRIVTKQVDIDLLTARLAENKYNGDEISIIQSRLTEDINSRKNYRKQLVKIINSAKYIKNKGTFNELRRFNSSGNLRKG